MRLNPKKYHQVAIESWQSNFTLSPVKTSVIECFDSFDLVLISYSQLHKKQVFVAVVSYYITSTLILASYP